MISGLGYQEMLLFGVIALMLFGSRLPEVARNFGRTYRELRRKVDEFPARISRVGSRRYGQQAEIKTDLHARR